MQLSYWERESFFTYIDVAIVGAGIVGLSAAIQLKEQQPALNIAVLERGVLPYGASTRNAGFACFGSASELLDDLQLHSEEEVFCLVERRWKGLLQLRKNLGDENMTYENLGGYEVFTENDNTLYTKCANNIDYLNKHIAQITGIPNVYHIADAEIAANGLKQVNHLIKNSAEGQIDTGKMMKALLNKAYSLGISIFNGINIQSIEEQGSSTEIIVSETLRFKTKACIVATNAFAKDLLPDIDLKPGRAQVLITNPIPDLKLKGAFHYDCGYYYFRNVGNRVLLGGGRNLDFKTEETTEFGLTELVQHKLEELLREVILPDTPHTIDMRWSGFLGLGSAKTNIVKQFSPSMFCAIRCGGMGVAIGSLLGEEVANLLLEHLY